MSCSKWDNSILFLQANKTLTLLRISQLKLWLSLIRNSTHILVQAKLESAPQHPTHQVAIRGAMKKMRTWIYIHLNRKSNIWVIVLTKE